MSDWQDKSDPEINHLVTMIEGGFDKSDYSKVSGNYHKGHVLNCDYSVGVVHDYCNKVIYAWPIILENKISVIFDNDEIYANQGNLEHYPWVKHEHSISLDGNPLRAAMIVYLEMNGVKPNE